MQEQIGRAPAGVVSDRPQSVSTGAGEQEPLLTLVSHRLVNFRTMSRPLRLLILVMLAQLVLIGILTALHDVPQPMLSVLVGGSHTIELPTVAFVVGFISFAVAWSALMTGALHGHWIARWLAVTMFGFVVFVVLGDETVITTDPTTNELLSPFRAQLLWLPLLAMPLLVATWALVVWLVLRRRARAGNPDRGGTFAIVTFLVMLASILASFALCAGYLGLSGRVDAFPNVLADELWLLAYPLLAALLFTGTDYAEWGEALAGRLARVRGHARRIRPLALVTALLCLAILVGVPALILIPGVQLAGNSASVPGLLLGSFLLDLVLIATLAGVMWLGRVREWPRLRVTFGGLLLSTLAVTLAATLVALGGPLGILLGIALWPVLGVVLVIRGRRRPGAASATGLYLVVVGLSVVAFAATISAFGQSPAAALGGVQLAAALFTLVALTWLALRGRLDARNGRLVYHFFVLNGGLLLIGVLYVVQANVGSRSRGFGLIPAVLTVVAFLWDFLTSGEEVTNVEGRAFPRNTRVLLYAGYTMLVSTIVLFFAPVTADSVFSEQGDLFFVFNTELWPRYGLLLLGVPLLVTSFALSTSRGRSAQRAVQSGVAYPLPYVPNPGYPAYVPYPAYPGYPAYPPQLGLPQPYAPTNPYPPAGYPPQPGYPPAYPPGNPDYGYPPPPPPPPPPAQ